MKRMTEANLNSAYSGESMAHMRYLIYADVADSEGKHNVARLFRAIAAAEKVHATNHYRELSAIHSTLQNLQTAIDGETFEVEEMYPSYKAVAELQGEKGAQRTTAWAWEAERIHAAMYQRAQQAVEGGQDADLGPLFICENCGYTVEGRAPEICPICKVSREKFLRF